MTIEYMRTFGTLYAVLTKHTSEISFAGEKVTFTTDDGETVKIDRDDIISIYED